MTYDLLHSPATHQRPRLLVVAHVDDLAADRSAGATGWAGVAADATARGLRTFVLAVVRGEPLPGSGMTHAVLSAEALAEIHGRCDVEGVWWTDVVTYLDARRDLPDRLRREVDRLRPAVLAVPARTTPVAGRAVREAALRAARAAHHAPRATYLLGTGHPTDLDGRPVVDPWHHRHHHQENAS